MKEFQLFSGECLSLAVQARYKVCSICGIRNLSMQCQRAVLCGIVKKHL